MRCLSLALALRSRGVQVEFLTRCRDHQLLDRILTHGFPIHELKASISEESLLATEYEKWLGVPWQMDAEETLTLLRSNPPDWLVVDHYGLNATWEHQLRPACKAMLVIDDLPERRHQCDLLIDQNLQPEGTRHSTRVENSDAEVLIGPRYAMLADVFRKAREMREVATRESARPGWPPRLVIFFGGTDPTNETAKALAALETFPSGAFDVDVVAGALNQNLSELESSCHKLGFRLHLGADMASLYASADFAMGAPGVSSWERMCVGVPSVLVSVAENQERIGLALEHAGYVIYLGESSDVTVEDYAGVLKALPYIRGELQRQAQRGRELVDGRGAARIVSRMLHWWTKLRTATLNDSQTIYAWRNSEAVRSCSFDQAPIPWDTHEQWLRLTLENPDRLLLIAEEAGEPVGVVRFDCKDVDATISIFLNPDHMGKGFGSAVLRSARQWLVRERPAVRRIFADVIHGNYASETLFREAGYQESSARYVLPIHG